MANKTIAAQAAVTLNEVFNAGEMADSNPLAEQTFALAELAELVGSGKSQKLDCELPTVSVRDLSDNYLNCKVKFDALEVALPKSNVKVVTEDCLIACYVGGKFLVGKLVGVPEGGKVALRQNMIAFKLKSDLLNESFLLRSFFLPDSEKQAKELSTGAVVALLSDRSFLKIEISVPTQYGQELCQELDVEDQMTDSEMKLKQEFDEFNRDVHMTKHAMGQTIFHLSSLLKTFMKASDNANGVISLDDVVGKGRPMKVSDVVNGMQEAVNTLRMHIEMLDRGNGLQVKQFGLVDFIEDYITKHQSTLFSFDFDGSKHRWNEDFYEPIWDEDGMISDFNMNEIIVGKDDPMEVVNFAPEALIMVFDDIVSNARDHGFEGRETGNVIRITIENVGSKYVVVIANNGAPLNSQLTGEDVFAYARSSKSGKGHSGLGGNEVRKLMRKYNGEADFVNDPDAEFPVAYKLTFNETNLAGSFKSHN